MIKVTVSSDPAATVSAGTIVRSESGGGAGGGAGIVIDSTLTQSGQAADAAVVGNRLSALSEEIANQSGGGGLSQNAKSLLITILRNATYEIDQTANITALETALSESTEPEQPESGIVQSGSVLAITSGVTVIQTGSMLAVS